MPQPPIPADTAAGSTWQNEHENFKQKIAGIFAPTNGESGDAFQIHRTACDAIQARIKQALSSGEALRGRGSRWSFTKVAATDGIQLDNHRLNQVLPLAPGMVSSAYVGDVGNLVLVQAGIRVHDLSLLLAAQGKSLKTSGASDGQAIAGAMSTGTHGAALAFGAVPDFVVGIQIATGDAQTYWLERASAPVASDQLISELGAAAVKEDELFNAALVSFGSFGVILAVLIEVRDDFLLMDLREAHPLNSALYTALTQADFSGLSHASGGETPHHFDVIVDPHAVGKDNQTLVSIMHELPAGTAVSAEQAPNPPRLEEFTAELRDAVKDEFSLLLKTPGIAKHLDSAKEFARWLSRNFDCLDWWCFRGKWDKLIPRLVALLLSQRYPSPRTTTGRHREMFGPTDTFGRIASAAIGFDASNAEDVLKLVLKLQGEGRAVPGGIGNRLVKGGSATLGINRFPLTCVLEIDGLACRRMNSLYRRLWKELEAQEIDHSIHWGKLYEWTPQRARARTGGDAAERWISARKRLLPTAEQREVFSNDFLRQAGLDE